MDGFIASKYWEQTKKKSTSRNAEIERHRFLKPWGSGKKPQAHEKIDYIF